jgi:hypothetical protein
VLCGALAASIEADLTRREVLLATGDEPIEGRWGPGENLLGRALMHVRARVRARASDPNAIQCEHQNEEEPEVVCAHWLSYLPVAEVRPPHHRRYTGVEARYEVLCEACGKVAPDARPLRFVCRRCFSELHSGPRLEDLGTPQIRERATSLRFTHETCPAPAKVLAFVPIPRQPNSWLLLDEGGRFHRLDVARGTSEPGGRLAPGSLDLSKWVVLAVSPGGELAAVGEGQGTRGVVVEPVSGEVTLSLSRGDYHVENCRYPLAFFELDGRLLLVHGTDWNRLDASDPWTGECLTRREDESEHALDYFHSQLTVSPGGTRLLDTGWVWHPMGAPRVFSLQRWLRENRWESEDGSTVKGLGLSYDWDNPVAWLDERTVAIWGDDGRALAPVAVIYDAETGEELRRFLGPGAGFAVVPPYLVAFDPWAKTAVWDPVSGERLAHDAGFCPAAGHPLSHELVSLEGEAFRVSRLEGREAP